jgi:hypothetical protein
MYTILRKNAFMCQPCGNGKFPQSQSVNNFMYYKEMKMKKNLLMLAVAVLTLASGINQAPAVEKSGSKPVHRLPVEAPKDGGGPMCIPSIGCGYR